MLKWYSFENFLGQNQKVLAPIHIMPKLQHSLE